jgi:WD40 repeat protein
LESKIYSQISLNFNASVIALYVDDFSSGRASGFVGASQGSNVYVYDLNGKLVLELPEAHEGDVISLYITKDDLSRKESMGGDEEIKSEDKNKGGEYCLISAGNDGKIKFWKIFE